MRLKHSPLLWTFVLAQIGICLPVIVLGVHSRRLDGLHILVLVGWVLGLGLLACVLLRIGRFRSRLFQLLRHLLAGNYEVGLPSPGRWGDEITELQRLLEQFLEQLRAYDTLRARRIEQCQRTLDTILDNAAQPVMVYQVNEEHLLCNAAMQTVLNAPKKTYALSAIEKMESNRSFVDLLRQTGREESPPQPTAVHLQLPHQESTQEIRLQMIPIRNRNEDVQTVLFFGELGAPPSNS